MRHCLVDINKYVCTSVCMLAYNIYTIIKQKFYLKKNVFPICFTIGNSLEIYICS